MTLKETRKKCGLTQKEAANIVGMSLRTYTTYEQDELSAEDFHALYSSVPDADAVISEDTGTFYGKKPKTAREMYEHTKSVNGYYFAEIDVEADNSGNIYECRKRGFELLEKKSGFLSAGAYEGSYGEMWSVKKVLRRFIWHDRIHAKAMYRRAKAHFGDDKIDNPFVF